MKTQVFIVTGFLGAGKTTLLKQILRVRDDLSKTVVLVNEFGKTGIDSALIKRTAAADIVELNSGCICCSLRTDLIQTLQILRHDYSPERIVIEATGVADPLAIIAALDDRMLSPYFSVAKTVTVVDCDFWEAREAFGYVFKNQLALADILLLNKIDTFDASKISSILQEINDEVPKARIIPTIHCNIDPDIFWAGTEQEEVTRGKTGFLHPYVPEKDVYGTPTAKEAGFVSFSFQTTRNLDEALFTQFLDTVPLTLFRIKGPVCFAGGTRMLNFVGGKKHWQKWPDTASTHLAFIGWDVIETSILEKLNTCMVDI
jgi:G3E family GTPase